MRNQERARRPVSPSAEYRHQRTGLRLVATTDHAIGLPVLRLPCVHAVATNPAQRLAAYLTHFARRISLPRSGEQVGLCNVFFEDCSAFTHVTACTLAGPPKMTRYIRGFRVSERVTPLAPHRPHRAELPQRVPQGDSLGGPSVADAWSQKGIAREKLQIDPP
jgi:hypothetical protein